MKGARQGCKVVRITLECTTDTAAAWRKTSTRRWNGSQSRPRRVSPEHKTRPASSTTARDDTKRRSSGSRNRPLKATLYANHNLASCYEIGKGVKKDIPEALKLYAKAAEKGHAKAKVNLRRLIDEMR